MNKVYVMNQWAITCCNRVQHPNEIMKVRLFLVGKKTTKRISPKKIINNFLKKIINYTTWCINVIFGGGT